MPTTNKCPKSRRLREGDLFGAALLLVTADGHHQRGELSAARERVAAVERMYGLRILFSGRPLTEVLR